MPNPDRLLTVAQACERLGCSERSLWYWLKERGLPHILLSPKKLRIPEADLDAWVLRDRKQTLDTAARWRLLAWALQRSPALAALIAEKPATVYYWAIGDVPRLTLPDGTRLAFTAEALKAYVGVADEVRAVPGTSEEMAGNIVGGPSGYRSEMRPAKVG